jgi:hypothetical protein
VHQLRPAVTAGEARAFEAFGWWVLGDAGHAAIIRWVAEAGPFELSAACVAEKQAEGAAPAISGWALRSCLHVAARSLRPLGTCEAAARRVTHIPAHARAWGLHIVCTLVLTRRVAQWTL